MDQFGVQKPELKAIAHTPVLPSTQADAPASSARDTAPQEWLGACIRNIADEAKRSAFGLPGVTGVALVEVPAGSTLLSLIARAFAVWLAGCVCCRAR